jgi:hypothetical protein
MPQSYKLDEIRVRWMRITRAGSGKSQARKRQGCQKELKKKGINEAFKNICHITV